MEHNTVFSKIIRGEIPATKVYEDEYCLAFLDIHPQSKGHLLLIPKKQVGRIHQVPDDILQYLILKTKMLTNALISGILCDYVQIEIVGKDIPDYFHIHLIPRQEDDNIPESSYCTYEEGESSLIAEQIRTQLP